MRASRFSDAQKAFILKQGGLPVVVPVHGLETPICAYAAIGIRPS